MNAEFGEKLQEALNKAKNDVNSFVWKTHDGKLVKLMDSAPEDLRKWFTHCYEMLYNTSKSSQGKYKIRENIWRIWNACNVELFVRHLLYECNTAIKTKKDILDYINTQKASSSEDLSNSPITILFNGLDPIYEKITINQLIEACLDRLNIINKKLISDKFILSQGVWLTREERLELRETNENGEPRSIMEVMKERLSLDPGLRIRVEATGFTFNEFRALVQLPALPKISELPTFTLMTLRDKVLYLLDNDIDYHITKWNTLMSNIKKVAEVRNISLTTSND